jgi:hypothetical protein
MTTHGYRNRLSTTGCAQFTKDTGYVKSHSARTYNKLISYLGIGLSAGNESEHLVFSFCQMVSPGPCECIFRTITQMLIQGRMSDFVDYNNNSIHGRIVEEIVRYCIN